MSILCVGVSLTSPSTTTLVSKRVSFHARLLKKSSTKIETLDLFRPGFTMWDFFSRNAVSTSIKSRRSCGKSVARMALAWFHSWQW